MKKFTMFLLFFMADYFFLPVVFAQSFNDPSYSIEILSPKAEETFQNDVQSITLQLSINPELASEDKVVVYVNGTAVTEPAHNTSIEIPYLERGPHTIQAKIIQKGGSGAETNIITIYQQRASALLPRH